MIFSEEKVAQMAAYFLMRRGHKMSYLKLMKLLYLADREALAKFDEPISFDRMVSMIHGPVLSRTYDLMTSHGESFWGRLIQGEADYEVSLKNPQTNMEDLDELSTADIQILDTVWKKFGGMNRWEIRDWTHLHCPEWEDPNGSSYPINPRAVFEAFGCSADDADEKARNLIERKQLGQILASLQ